VDQGWALLVAYSTAVPPVIVGVFHDTADIPNRI
jgi:hypothetical protein